MRVTCPICTSENCRLLSPYHSGRESFLGADSIQACQSCGLVFAWPHPPDEQLDMYYRDSQYYEDVTPYTGVFQDFSYKLACSRLHLITRYLSLENGQRWLDVGAGNAVLGYALKQLQPNAIYEAVEPNHATRQGWGDWVAAHFDDLSKTPTETYYVITLNQVLEHIKQPITFLKDIGRRLVSGGLVFVDVPNRDDLFKPDIEPHLLFWEKDSLVFALEKAGFDVLFCDTAGMPWRRARRFFMPTLMDRIIDPWRWVSRLNQGLSKFGVKLTINTFPQFQADRYGGERQWLRCLARKTDS